MTWRGEKSCPYWDSTSHPSAFQPIASCYTHCAIPASHSKQQQQQQQQQQTISYITDK
jgi:hypothetical protein